MASSNNKYFSGWYRNIYFHSFRGSVYKSINDQCKCITIGNTNIYSHSAYMPKYYCTYITVEFLKRSNRNLESFCH